MQAFINLNIVTHYFKHKTLQRKNYGKVGVHKMQPNEFQVHVQFYRKWFKIVFKTYWFVDCDSFSKVKDPHNNWPEISIHKATKINKDWKAMNSRPCLPQILALSKYLNFSVEHVIGKTRAALPGRVYFHRLQCLVAFVDAKYSEWGIW